MRFVYLEKEGEKKFIVLDGVNEKQYNDIDDIIFSHDSKRLAYAAMIAENGLLYLMEKKEIIMKM